MSDHRQGVYTYGSPDAPLLIINPCPTPQEAESGLPFSGRAGLVLWNTLKRFGYDRTNVRIVQRVCEPGRNSDGLPSTVQMQQCRAHFEEAIKESQATVVLLLGGMVTREVLGISGKIDDLNGYIFDPSEALNNSIKITGMVGIYKTDRKCGACKGLGHTPNADPCLVCGGKKYLHRKGDDRYGKITVVIPPTMPPNAKVLIPTLHPETLRLQGYKHTFAFTTSVERAVRAVKDELEMLNEDDFEEFPYVPESTSMVAFDIETDIQTGAIERIGFSWREGLKLVTWTSPWTPRAKEVAKSILENPSYKKIAHNIMFDTSHLSDNGIEVRGEWVCTMQGGAMLQPDLLKGLGRMAPLYMDLKRWKHKSENEPAKYNALDAKIDLRLGEHVLAGLSNTGMLPLYRKIMETYPTLLKMTQRGIRVDMNEAVKWREELTKVLRGKQHEWNTIIGPVNYLSPKQLQNYLYDKLDLPVQFNKYGRVSTDEEAIKSLMGVAPKKHIQKLKLLLDMRETAKQLGTYANVEASDDGCIHPNYAPANKETTEKFGVRSGMPATGRLASNNPNIQNWTKEAKRVIIPHWPDQILLEFDYNQLELWIVAALADDDNLKAALRKGVHQETMRVLGIKNKVLAKNIVYGTAYGAGPKKLSKMLRMNGIAINELETAAFQQKLFKAYPKWFEYRQYITTKVITERKLTNAFGRIRPFYGGQADVTKALDYPPQSNGADMVWTRIIPANALAESHGGGLLTTIHDSFLAEVKRDRVPIFVPAMKGILETEFEEIAPGFRVPVSVKIGENWGEMVEYEA